MHACTYVCMHGYECMHACMYACMHVCMHPCMYVCMYACMHASVHICMYIYTYGVLTATSFLSGLWRQHLCSRNCYPLWSQQPWSFQSQRKAATCRVFDNKTMTFSKKFGSLGNKKVIGDSTNGRIARKKMYKKTWKDVLDFPFQSQVTEDLVDKIWYIKYSQVFTFWGGDTICKHPYPYLSSILTCETSEERDHSNSECRQGSGNPSLQATWSDFRRKKDLKNWMKDGFQTHPAAQQSRCLPNTIEPHAGDSMESSFGNAGNGREWLSNDMQG